MTKLPMPSRKPEQVAASAASNPDYSSLEPHSAALKIPPLSEDDYDGLKQSIKANGLIHPIELFDGKILEGVHRYKALKELGIEFTAKHFTPVQPDKNFNSITYVLDANLHRRHLTGDQKRQLIATYIDLNPEKSNVAISEDLGISDVTIGKARRWKEETLEGSSRAKTIRDAIGRQRPARINTSNRPSKRKQPASKLNQAPKLSSLAWSEASEKARAQFVSAVGLKSLFAAAPKNLRDRFIDDQIKAIREDASVKTHFKNGKPVSGKAF